MTKPLWDTCLGRTVTRRSRHGIAPHLRWNRQIWGETVMKYLAHPVRWLDSGCGRRLLGEGLEALENELVSLARIVVGVDVDFPHLLNHD
jgi:hypothetical protein